jgi:phosphatidylglycerol:prolipoprotein diacylglycerol transferase
MRGIYAILSDMFPILLHIGRFTLYTFSIFLVLAFFLCGFILWRRSREEHYAEDEVFDVFLISIFWGVLVSRIAFILFNISVFKLDLFKWVDMLGSPGLVPLFGFIAVAGFIFREAKKRKWDTFEVLDIFSIGTALGSAVVWLGLFFSGSGFGYPTKLPWGVMFPNVFDKHHPVQLYGLIIYIVLFAFLSWLEPRYRRFGWYRNKSHTAQTGFLFATFCMLFGLSGILLSVVSPAQLHVFNIPLDIPFRIIIFLYGAGLLWIRSGRSFLGKK